MAFINFPERETDNRMQIYRCPRLGKVPSILLEKYSNRKNEGDFIMWLDRLQLYLSTCDGNLLCYQFLSLAKLRYSDS